MTMVPSYGHQEHIICNSFNKYTEIHVQIKYQKLMMMMMIIYHLHKV
jgi:hypothetical protein